MKADNKNIWIALCKCGKGMIQKETERIIDTWWVIAECKCGNKIYINEYWVKGL